MTCFIIPTPQGNHFEQSLLQSDLSFNRYEVKLTMSLVVLFLRRQVQKKSLAHGISVLERLPNVLYQTYTILRDHRQNSLKALCK